MARPKKVINEKLLKELASIQCSLEEMASALEVSVDTLGRRYAEVIKSGRELGKMSLKRKQFQVAMGGNVGMLIWLGKIVLGQRDTTEHVVIPGNHYEAKEKLANMYQRIEQLARERKMKYLTPEPTQGLLVTPCPTPQVPNKA